jgi:hypothetical protein
VYVCVANKEIDPRKRSQNKTILEQFTWQAIFRVCTKVEAYVKIVTFQVLICWNDGNIHQCYQNRPSSAKPVDRTGLQGKNGWIGGTEQFLTSFVLNRPVSYWFRPVTTDSTQHPYNALKRDRFSIFLRKKKILPIYIHYVEFKKLEAVFSI